MQQAFNKSYCDCTHDKKTVENIFYSNNRSKYTNYFCFLSSPKLLQSPILFGLLALSPTKCDTEVQKMNTLILTTIKTAKFY